ncbi:MAG UNVERIFIED_CONTAM: tryptophan synthase subunit alpha, partial [Thermobifida fusca]
RAVTRDSGLPICVGLGISNGAQAAEVASYADGVIVGTGFCQRVLDAPDVDTACQQVRDFAAELAAGVRAAAR